MGAVIRRISQVARWLGILLMIAAALPAFAAQRQPKKSPHGALNIPCENCHTATSWAPIRAIPEFNHDLTKYPLRGMHEKVACTGCHVKPVFTDVGKDCANCHADFHRGQFGANCAQCHTVSGWQVSVQQISQHFNRFPLLGAHAVVQCEECHKNAAAGDYLGLSTACESCHMSDFNGTTNPAHKSNMTVFSPSQCANCHGFDTWLNAKFDHSSTGFLLQDAHATAACASCHIANNYNLSGIAQNDCGNSGCHLTTWQQTTNPSHSANATWFPVQNCTTCHNSAPITWTGGTFPNHGATGFNLTQGHASLQCAQCHINNNYALTIAPTDCGNSQCHLTTWQQTTTPVHSTSGAAFGASNCANCHTPAGWDAASFNHSVTGFTLTGTHMSPTPTACAACHINNNYSLSSADCYGCHSASFQSTTTIGGNVPNHITAGFPTTAAACATCHPITTWSAGVFDHSATGFPLTQGHANVQCALCHINSNYSLQIAATDCGNSQCHLTTWQQTNNPAHASAGAPFAASLCSSCHTTAGWTTASFNHNSTTFPLTGFHTTVACALCHVNNNYSGTVPATCIGCHLTDWNSTATLGGAVPNHITSGFPQDCTQCHSTTNWSTATFNHNNTTFPLTGAHTATACALCHVNNDYTGDLPTTCYNCHITAWNSTQTLGGAVPNHVTAAFPQDCTLCHTTTNWTSSTFNHSTTTFPLTGLHTSAACASCHVGSNYAGTLPTTCDGSGCHLATWQGTTAPPHQTVSATFTAFASANCSTCHTTSVAAFATATWDHGTTGFALTGAHLTGTCVSCHVGNNYALPATTCYTCHTADWNSTATLGGAVPNHITAGFPQDCTVCHSTTNWTTSTFNHATTAFPLTGFHTTVACALCHTAANGNYGPTVPTLCSGCHMTDYNSTQTLGGSVPNHVAAAYPTTCDQCHTTTSWLGATFNHAATGFALTGMHATIACNLCHLAALGSTAPPIDCYSCHTADWNSTQNLGGLVPNHVAAALISASGFSTSTTACSTCHNTTAWTGATFTHPSSFPTSHGNAGGVCSMCHTNSADYTVFQCTGCHGNNNSANFHHPGVGGYVYSSPACYACHSRGNGG
jgi:hypothetical protein